MSLKFVFVCSSIFTVFGHFSSSKVSSVFLVAENPQLSINVSDDLKANQSRNVLSTSLKDIENAPDCSSGSWKSSSNCTELPQVYFSINNAGVNKEKETTFPHEDLVSIETLSTNAKNVSLHGHPVNRTTVGENIGRKMIMSYVVAQPLEIKKFTPNSTKSTNVAEIRSTRNSPRMRRARAKTKSVSKKIFKGGFIATKPAVRRQKPNGKSRKKRHWPVSETAIKSARNRRTRVTKKFPAEFESVLKRVFPDNFVTAVRNNNYYRSGNKIQQSSDLNVSDGACSKNRNSSNRRQKIKKPAAARFDEEPLYFRAGSDTTGTTISTHIFTKIITKIATEILTEIETYTATATTGTEVTTAASQTESVTEKTGTEQTGTEQTGTETTGTEQTETEQTLTGQTGTSKESFFLQETGTETGESEMTSNVITFPKKGKQVHYHYYNVDRRFLPSVPPGK